MKKIYMLLTALLLTGSFAKAQDTLLYEDFETIRFYDTTLIDCNVLGSIPPGNVIDANWYSWDSDGLPDAHTGGGAVRPDGYYASYPFSPVDLYPTIYGGTPPDSNTVISAGSWTNDPGAEANWLITSNIKLGAHDTLFWKSAPLQTPRYLDGYQVLLSQTNNSDNTSSAFSTVLFNAAEMTGTPFGGSTGTSVTFSDFTFAATATGGPTAFVHGQDGTYMDAAGTTAPISRRGQLRPFSVPLDAYANKNVFIAFYHNTHDDNAISFDDVMVRGTPSNPLAGIIEASNVLELNLFPNPATDNVQVNYNLTAETTVTINIYDVAGKLVASDSKGEQAQGRHFANINSSEFAKGFYTVKVVTSLGQSTSKLIVR